MVKHNGRDSYTFQLAIGSISIFMNGGIYVIGGSAFYYKKTKCDFLGEIEFSHKIDFLINIFLIHQIIKNSLY